MLLYEVPIISQVIAYVLYDLFTSFLTKNFNNFTKKNVGLGCNIIEYLH